MHRIWDNKMTQYVASGRSLQPASFQWWHRFVPGVSAGWGPRESTEGPTKLVSDYFVSQTDIIESPQHNLFTARDGVLVALISLTGIIAVMIGFARNTDSHVKTSSISDWTLWNMSQTDVLATAAFPQYNISPHQINFLRALWSQMSKGFSGKCFLFFCRFPACSNILSCQSTTLSDLNTIPWYLHNILIYNHP